MSVTIAGRVVDNLSDLPEAARIVLGFVAGGNDWLSWAMASASEIYAFDGEGALVEGVQSGLHGDDQVVVRALALQAGAQRLLELDLPTLELMRTAASKGGKPTLKTRKALAAADLLTAPDLATARDFLSRVGMAGEPLFQTMRLADLVAVFALADESPESKDAAGFAVGEAANPGEFVDLYRFYLAVVSSVASKAANPAKQAEDTRQLLLPFARNLLRCPHAPGELTMTEAGTTARAWLEAGYSLGFPTVSRGLVEIASFYADKLSDSKSAQLAAKSYNDQARALLGAHDPYASRVTQDGSRRLFEFDGSGATAVLAHDRQQGSLTLLSLRRR